MQSEQSEQSKQSMQSEQSIVPSVPAVNKHPRDTWPFKSVNDGMVRQFNFNGELFFRNFHNEIYSIKRVMDVNEEVADQWVGIYDPVRDTIDTFLRQRIDGETLKEYRGYISLKRSEQIFQAKSDYHNDFVLQYKEFALQKQQLIEKAEKAVLDRQMKKSAKAAEKAEKKLADLRVKAAAKAAAKAKKLSESIQKEAAHQLLKEAKAIQKKEMMAQRAIKKRAERNERIAKRNAESGFGGRPTRLVRLMERAVERKMAMQKREEKRQIQSVARKEQDIENRPKLLEKLFVKGGITWQPLAFHVYMKWFPTAPFEPKENQNRFTRMNAFVNKMGHLFQPENSEALIEYMVQANECV